MDRIARIRVLAVLVHLYHIFLVAPLFIRPVLGRLPVILLQNHFITTND